MIQIEEMAITEIINNKGLEMKILAAARILAAMNDELAIINKLTGLKIDPSQAEGFGFRLTHQQGRDVMDRLLKLFGRPEETKPYIKYDLARAWNADGYTIITEVKSSDPRIAPLIYLSKD